MTIERLRARGDREHGHVADRNVVATWGPGLNQFVVATCMKYRPGTSIATGRIHLRDPSQMLPLALAPMRRRRGNGRSVGVRG